MEEVRYFVGNLNATTKKEHLKQLFQDYGEVKNIELKFKDINVKNEKVIAFVTMLHISKANAEYFAGELSCRKLNGLKLKVSLAKESFLERLRREREEVVAASTTMLHYAPTISGQKNLLPENLKNTHKIFNDDFEEDYEIAPELLMKKRASNSLQSGRIFIQSFNTTPVHIVKSKNSKKTKIKSKDVETSTAEQKRKESVLKMQNEYQQKKSMIQKALTNLDSVTFNKIIFSDDEEKEKNSANNTKSKTDIFGFDDNNEADQTNDTEVLSKFDHLSKKKCEELIKLQSHQSLDPRFRIDTKFLDDVEDDYTENEQGVIDAQNQNIQSETLNERDWQLNILEEVIGTKIDKNQQKTTKNRKMLHFDPFNQDHNEMLHNKSEELNKKAEQYTNKPKKQNLISVNIDTQIKTKYKVSLNAFYTVNDTLAEILEAPSDYFSLLKMFGKADELEKHGQLKKVCNQRVTISNKIEGNVIVNPFCFNDEIQDTIDNEMVDYENAINSSITSNKKQTTMLETFFMYKKDERLKEGANFYSYEKDPKVDENYEEVRNHLKKLIKTKIVKSRNKRASLGRGATPKKKMKKF